MATTCKVTKDLLKYFRIRRVDTEEGSFVECNHKEGMQFLDMQGIHRGQKLDVATVLIALKLRDK
jgi:hypothetical protein